MVSTGFTSRERLQVLLSVGPVIPFTALIVLGLAETSLTIAITTGVAIVAAAFVLAWSTETLQFYVSQALALSILAVIQVLPEYSFEVVLVWEGALDLVTASLTGANRLLLGLGWPLIFFVSYFAARRHGFRGLSWNITLDAQQSVTIVFLGVATLYSFLIVAKQTLTVVDAAVLLFIFALYLVFGIRLPAQTQGTEHLAGPTRKLLIMTRRRRNAFVLGFILLGAYIILFGAEPFVSSLRDIAIILTVSQFFFIQWVAPFLSEFPESVTAFYWAARRKFASLGLSNLITSKLNQWTLLIATIPIVYAIKIGGISSINLTPLQQEEILLTAAQSLFGFVCLLDLRFKFRDAAILLGLFLTQFFFPSLRLEVTIAYFIMAAIELYLARRNLLAFSAFRTITLEQVIRRRSVKQHDN